MTGRERRQLTILFCDLSGSTALAARMDAEDFGELVNAYFKLCDATFKRYGGYVDREEGDSLRVYFGYPIARDDDPLRAVHAALEIVAAVNQLGVGLGTRLGVHIGIHTGEVVAGEASLEEHCSPRVVGETPNVARRLQELAPSNSVYLSATTLRMVERNFEAEALGPQGLKGLPRPVQVFRLVGQRGHASTIEQFDSRSLTPLVSRDGELSLLEQRWKLAGAAQGQVVLVKGEPGIGKSRLLHAFLARPGRGPCRILTTECQRQFSNSALYPMIDLLQRDLGLKRERSAADRALALQGVIDAGRMPSSIALQLLGSTVTKPGAATHPQDSARAQRERSLQWLVQWVLGSEPGTTVVLAIEDLHWADASTLDFLDILLDQAHGRSILVLLTCRNEFMARWTARTHFTELALQRVRLSEARTMAQNIAGPRSLPDDVVEQVATRSDGIPLFVEELTKMLLEARDSGDSQHEQAHRTRHVASQASAVRIPETLRGSLTARLDYLVLAKPVAQVASVLGREFSYDLLRLVSGLGDERLRESLAELVQAELLFQRGVPPNVSFVFKHALVQEAAYLSLLKARRAEYHAQAAAVLVHHFADSVEQHPELAAHHFATAGKPGEACDLWHRAGQRALEASADVEAASYLRLALQQLELLPEHETHSGREVNCLITLGSALTASRGYAALEVEEVFARAHTLCQSLGDTQQLYAALMGLHTFYQVRGSLKIAVALGEQLVEIAEERNDRLWRAQSHRCLGWSLFCNGRLEEGAQHLSIALSLFDRFRAQEHVRTQGAHPWVVGFVNTALLEWFAGRPDRAVECSDQALELARELRSPLPLAYALCMSAQVYCLRREPQRALVLAEEAIDLALKHRMPYWSSWGMTLQGWALVHSGQHEAGLKALHRGLEDYRATGARLFEVSSLALLADSYATADQPGRAMKLLERAMADPLVTEGYFYTGELLRLQERVRPAAGAVRLAASPGSGSFAFSRAAPDARASGSAAPGATE